MKTKNAMMFLEEDGDGGGGASLLATGGDAGDGQQQKGGGDGGGSGGEEFTWTDATGAFNRDWLSKLPPELEAARPMLEKYRSLPDLAKAAYHKEQLLGKKSGAVVIPTEKSSPEEIAAFRKALGIPEKADEYKLKPEKLPDGVSWNDENGKALAELALKHNIAPAAIREVVGWMLNGRAGEAQAMQLQAVEKAEAEHKQNLSVLQDAWKGDLEKNLEIARRTAVSVGLDPNSKGLGDPEVVKALVRLGSMTKEDSLVTGSGGGELGTGNPGATAKDIMTNPDNPMYKRYKAGEPDVVDYVRGLNRKASGG